ncbi:hypothetical protein GQ43DRAFT_104827 [Delitschia confertaspora ATCC 74209]|uniref:C2H2-type domain-containing protein n=1 Tax=Delitschia confertaspora ATCC 74209 TaxID=1513339 RepID=A0A9P4JMZ2_9PLEO|nr:hypothetical protein GQ43DRAFT_104827 [Delitschia confertaspora ATCC 74209]
MSHPQYADSSKSPAQQPHTSAPYPPAYASSLSLQNHEQTRRSGDYAVLPPYQPSSGPRSPYQPSLASMRVSPAPLNYPPSSSEPTPILSPPPHNYNYPAIQPSIPPLVSNNSSYPPQPIYPPTSYEMGYTPLPPTMYPPSTSSAPYSPYEQPASLPPPISAPIPPPSSERTAGNVMPRVLNSRPKPQCWEHGCNGRQFSTFSNLLRHQREKSGTAAKSYCKNCGAEFTRTTARNGHYVNGKCKPRRASDTSR